MARDIRLDIDLSDGATGLQVFARNQVFRSFTVITCPPGTQIELAAGSGDYFPYAEGDTWFIDDPCEMESEGLRCNAPAQPGVSVVLQVGLTSQIVQGG